MCIRDSIKNHWGNGQFLWDLIMEVLRSRQCLPKLYHLRLRKDWNHWRTEATPEGHNCQQYQRLQKNPQRPTGLHSPCLPPTGNHLAEWTMPFQSHGSAWTMTEMDLVQWFPTLGPQMLLNKNSQRPSPLAVLANFLGVLIQEHLGAPRLGTTYIDYPFSPRMPAAGQPAPS